MGYVPFTARPHCGANVALVGKAHRCVAVPAVNTPPAVNKPEVSKPAVNMKRTHARLHGEEAGLGQPVTACRDSYGPRRCVAHSPCQKTGGRTVPTVCIVRAPAEIQSRQRRRGYALRTVASNADGSSVPAVRTKPLENNAENGCGRCGRKITLPICPWKTTGSPLEGLAVSEASP